MKYFFRYRCVAALLFAAVVCQGCDWVKGQLGMPTSEDVARMKHELALEEVMRQEAARQAEQQARDSIEAAEAAARVQLEGYFVVVGAFKDPANAEKMGKIVGEMGYEPQYIPLKNGYMMVSAGNYSTLRPAREQMEKMQDSDECPFDIWIYLASQGLHEEK